MAEPFGTRLMWRGSSGRFSGQPKECAPAFVMLASDEASYISGANIAITGGKPII
jgi:NAD(P)-dependent dehydrogenase (short-subunit alcohol dehydrogenase family)